ncbi:MAG TPA: hypothetical protein VFR09_07115, partial [Alphaproteobacteria bacterium]|nr:hypothetical protein [Alphaproteobacteria bacterium]
MSRLLALLLCVLLAVPCATNAAPKAPAKKTAKPAAAAPANNEASAYHRAIEAIENGHSDQAEAVLQHGHDPALNKVLMGLYMAQPGNSMTYRQISAFIDAHPDWPGLKGILAIAEQKMPNDTPPSEVIAWYTAHPAVTTAGFTHATEALEANGQSQLVPQLVRARWIENDFGGEDLQTFHARFSRYLDSDTEWARLDRLLWKNDSVGARRMFVYVDDDMKAVADARLALANQNGNADAFIERVPGSWQNTPGLLYERLRWRVKNNMDDEALDILRRAPQELGKQEAWWEQRQIIIRRLLMAHDYDMAYRLSAQHGQTDPKTLIQGEFLAGWIALRFLNNPDRAVTHFQTLYDNASTPVSRARGAYWLGRSYEALQDKDGAEQAYETASALNITYYGQLASMRLYEQPTITAQPEPTIPGPTRQSFYNRDLIRAVERLHAIGEDDHVHAFFHAAVEAATQRSDFALLTELAYQIGRPDYAIEAAKAANQRNMM